MAAFRRLQQLADDIVYAGVLYQRRDFHQLTGAQARGIN